jgi:hypothetical protein
MEDNNPFELPKHHMQNDNGNNGNNGNGGNGNHYGWEHSDDTPAAPIENPLLGFLIVLLIIVFVYLKIKSINK